MSSLILGGDTSGTITLTVPTAAGTNTITLPALTGTAITTASTSNIPNTINWTTVQTSSVSPASAGVGYPMNTTSGALTVVLPAAPVAGNMISIVDYAGTAATNNITINPNGNKITGSTSNAIISTNREAVNLVYVDSTQGWLAYSDVYSTGNPVPQPYTVSYLVLAGGGSGGKDYAGGGGAGGLLIGTDSLLPGSVYTAVVGAGAPVPTIYTSPGNNGSNSTLSGSGITTKTALGGGGGATASAPSSSGGCGGGGGFFPAYNAAGSGTPGQGYNGGAGSPNSETPGGGGGTGAVGAAGNGGVSPRQAGAGGSGTSSSITGSAITYGGGGGGGGYTPQNSVFGAGGSGGGGAGSSSPGGSGTAGTANLGGGGGGGAGAQGVGGAGGSGVVILSVPTASYPGTTTGSPTITTSGSNTIIKWTSGSGTYTA